MLRSITTAFKCAVPLLSPRLLGAIVTGLALMTPTWISADTTDVRLRVVIYPAIGVQPPVAGKVLPFTVKDVHDDVLVTLMNAITSAYPLYSACVYDLASVPTPDCDPTTANILITTQFNPEPQPKDPASPNLIVTMRSLDMINGRVLATLPPIPLDVNALTSADAATKAKALAAIVPTDKLNLLLGSAVINKGRLSLFQGYEPYVQLVPTLDNSNTPTYLSLMSNLLDRRGIPSVPSQFNAGVVASGSTPLDTVCGRGQRYLVYSVSSENFSHPVSFSTRVQTHASAQLYDCTTMSVIPVGLDQHVSVLTTNGPLGSLLHILTLAFVSKSNSWSGTSAVAALVSPFIDTDVDKDSFKDSVADRALQGVVDRLCAKLKEPPPPPPLPPLLVRVPVSSDNSATRMTRQRAKTDAKGHLDRANVALAKATVKGTPAQRAAAVRTQSSAVQMYVAAALNVPSLATDGGSNNSSSTLTTTKAPEQQPGPTLVSLNVSGFLALSPPPLTCHGRRLDRWSGSSADPGRWIKPQ